MKDLDNNLKHSRNNIQITRRLFHMVNGSVVAMLYLYYMDKEELVTFLGIVASIIFLSEQVRIKYPELSNFFSKLNNILYRAEERLEIASAMPYAASCVLVVFVFPKSIAIITVLLLALGDPLSAIIGIKYGKHKIGKNRTVEGSITFFIVSFLVCFFVMMSLHSGLFPIFIFSLFGGIIGAGSDIIETRLDDNITIPLFSAPILSLNAWAVFGKII